MTPTVEELTRAARAMVAVWPDTLRLCTVGTSRAGRPLWLLSAGHGDRQVLTVAGAHANEPVGGASSLALAEELVRDPRVLDELGCTWHFLLCLDPDGMTLAGRRLPEQPTLDDYYQGFYRPAFSGQPEFPPVEADPSPPMPESLALIALIDELRPVVQFSLHGVEVGGTFLQLTRPVPGAPQAFRAVAAELEIPLEYRPFDGMGWFADSPGVLVLPDDGPADERDPSGHISQTTWMYAMRHGTVSAVVEAPMWSVAAVSAPGRVADPGREIARTSELLLSRSKRLAEVLGPLADQPPCPEARLPFYAAARELMDIGPGVVDTWNTHNALGLDDAGLASTVGNAVSLGIAARRIPLRAAAMMRGAFGGAFGGGPDAPRAPGGLDGMDAVGRRDNRDALDGLDALIREWSRELAGTFGARWLPVHRQTALHTRTMRRLVRQLLST